MPYNWMGLLDLMVISLGWRSEGCGFKPQATIDPVLPQTSQKIFPARIKVFGCN